MKSLHVLSFTCPNYNCTYMKIVLKFFLITQNYFVTKKWCPYIGYIQQHHQYNIFYISSTLPVFGKNRNATLKNYVRLPMIVR